MNEQLYKLLQKAREDAELRKRIWAVKEAKVAVMAVPYSPWMAGMTPSICSLPLWRHWRNKKRL